MKRWNAEVIGDGGAGPEFMIVGTFDSIDAAKACAIPATTPHVLWKPSGNTLLGYVDDVLEARVTSA